MTLNYLNTFQMEAWVFFKNFLNTLKLEKIKFWWEILQYNLLKFELVTVNPLFNGLYSYNFVFSK